MPLPALLSCVRRSGEHKTTRDVPQPHANVGQCFLTFSVEC